MAKQRRHFSGVEKMKVLREHLSLLFIPYSLSGRHLRHWLSRASWVRSWQLNEP